MLHRCSTTKPQWTLPAGPGAARPGAEPTISAWIAAAVPVDRQRVSLDTTQPCKNVRAAGEQLARWHWPRARGAFSVAGVVVLADGKVVLRVWK